VGLQITYTQIFYIDAPTVAMMASSLQRLIVLGFAVVVVCIAGFNNVNGEAVEPPIAEPDVLPIDYNHNGEALQGFVATPTSSDGPFPAVVIIP
jgi:hypothetical protein